MSSSVHVVPTSEAHVVAILKAGLRAQDLTDVQAMGREAEQDLRDLIEASAPNVFTIMVDGVPVALFGVAAYFNSRTKGIVWMRATDAFNLAASAFESQERSWLDHLNSIFPVVATWVNESNSAGRLWLEQKGFMVDGVEQDNGATFLRMFRAGPQSIN